MKKIFLFVAFAFAINANVSADNEATNSVENYNINANINSLVNFLNLSNDQVESFENVQKMFEENIRQASTMNGESRKNMVNNSIINDLKHMHYILNDEQFAKYRAVLNATIVNRNIETK